MSGDEGAAGRGAGPDAGRSAGPSTGRDAGPSTGRDAGRDADEGIDATHDLRSLAQSVAAFMDARDWAQYHAPKNVAAAIAVEAAELQQIYLWRALEDPADDKRREIEDEAADIAICLLNFCNRVGFELGPAMLRKLAAAERKYPAERVRGRSEKYDEYPEWEGE